MSDRLNLTDSEPFPDCRRMWQIARLAGSVVRFGFENPANNNRESKTDGTPVSWIDLASDAVLLRMLREAFPDIAVYSEESQQPPDSIRDSTYWLIDPLDATKEFLKGNRGHFCLTFGKLSETQEGYQPQTGIIYDPVSNVAWTAGANAGSWRIDADGQYSRCTLSDSSGELTLIENASSRNPLVSRLSDVLGLHSDQIVPQGSALKINLLLNGQNSFYWRPTPQMEWDIASMVLIARESGFRVSDMDGEPLRFNVPARRMERGLLIAPPKVAQDALLPLIHDLLQTASPNDLVDHPIPTTTP